MLLLSWCQVAKGSIRTRRKKKRRREKQVEGEERYDGAVFFHTISVSPCTATPLYNSTGRLNILRVLSSLFVSKHEPSGDLQIMQISNNVNKNWIFYSSKHVLYSSIITQSSWSKKKTYGIQRVSNFYWKLWWLFWIQGNMTELFEIQTSTTKQESTMIPVLTIYSP